MKKLLVALLTLVLSVTMQFPAYSAGENAPGADIKIYVDGELVITENPPVIENSRTLVPIRAVAEKAGIEVNWVEDTRSVILSFRTLQVGLTIDTDTIAIYNGETDKLTAQKLDAIPKIIDSRTYITLRAALEALGAGIEWQEETRSIYVTSPSVMMEREQNSENENEAEEIESSSLKYSGFREMTDHKILEGKGHGLYGRISSEKPITLVRCRIVGTDMDAQLRFNAEDNITSYNVFTYFDKLICFSDAGVGAQTFEIYAAEDGGEPRLVFSYDYTVTAKNAPIQEEEPKTQLGIRKIESDFSLSGFNEMENHTIKSGAPHELQGRIISDAPITYVRCRIVGSDHDAFLRFKAKDNLKNYNIKTYFDKYMGFSELGAGVHTLEIYAGAEGIEEQLVFCYDYEVLDESGSLGADTGAPAISFYGFRTMNDNVIKVGSPHGLYGTVISNAPLTNIRCRIANTDMDYSVALDSANKITSYNVFNNFDKLIRFSEAGLGEQIFEVYATVEGGGEKLVFSYKYTVKEELDTESDNSSATEKIDESKVCLPLEGGIRLTSPYGFRAYNKWEFHKGIDIVSLTGSLNIIAVADGTVVDCATGINSGAGNYVAIQHEGGWVSLYYHLKSYDVEIGDKVKMGEKFAIMGRTGGNYGVHLHFMTCDNWYGGIWATQNSHHTAPHEYVPQILSEVKYYTPNFEAQNKDKLILCQFEFPSELSAGEAFSISKSKAFLAHEAKSVKDITVTVTNANNEVELTARQESPARYSDGYYNYTNINVKLDMMCEFDKLTPGEKTITVSATTAAGRTRVVYTKNFVVTPKSEEVQEKPSEEVPESAEDSTEEKPAGEESTDGTENTENAQNPENVQGTENTADNTQSPDTIQNSDENTQNAE